MDTDNNSNNTPKIRSKEEFLESSLIQWFNIIKPKKSVNLPSKFDPDLVDLVDGCYISSTIEQILPSSQYLVLDKDARYGSVEQLAKNLHSCIVNLRRFFRKKKIILTECSIDVIAIATFAAKSKNLVSPDSSVENSPRKTENSKIGNDLISTPLKINKQNTSTQMNNSNTTTSSNSHSTTSINSENTVFEHLERFLWLFAFAIFNSENYKNYNKYIQAILNLDEFHQTKFMNYYFNGDQHSTFALVVDKMNPPIDPAILVHLTKVCDQRNQQYDEQFKFLIKSYSENLNAGLTTPNGSPIKHTDSLESLSRNSSMKNFHRMEADQLKRKIKHEQEQVESIQFDLDEVQAKYKNLESEFQKQRAEILNLHEYKHVNVNLMEEINELKERNNELSKVYDENQDMLRRTKDLEYYEQKLIKNQEEIDDLRNERDTQEEIYSNIKLRLDNMLGFEEDNEKLRKEKIVLETRTQELDVYVEQMKNMLTSLETQ